MSDRLLPMLLPLLRTSTMRSALATAASSTWGCRTGQEAQAKSETSDAAGTQGVDRPECKTGQAWAPSINHHAVD
jgi:hypothetical protein